MNKFDMGGSDYLNLCVLPAWNKLTEADLVGEPKKYY